MEDEWNKQGIGFRAQAEKGSWKTDDIGDGNYNDNDHHYGDYTRTADSSRSNSSGNFNVIADTTRATGSELLEDLERQCLVFDQYDRVVGKQEEEMKQRVERIREERIQK